jgi:hypothetical protein
MNPEDLQNFEPAWKNIPPPPTRLPSSSDADPRTASATIEEFTTSAPAPLSLDDGLSSGEAGDSASSPYQVRLVKTGPSSWAVTVWPGYVCQRIPGESDALSYAIAPDHWDGEELTKFPVEPGDAVYVKVEVNADGLVLKSGADAVTIVVEDDNTVSSHYQPKVDDDTPSGAAGVMYYKLAVIDPPLSSGEPPRLRPILAGSYIDHYQELPSIRTAVGSGDNVASVVKEWSNADKCYKFRAIDTTDGELTTEAVGNVVKLRGNEVDGSVQFIYEDGTSSQQVKWKDGLITEPGTDIVVNIPKGGEGGDGMPDGTYQGEMLYWDQTDGIWKFVAPPAPDPENYEQAVLHFVDGVPTWDIYVEKTIWICVEGDPQQFKILAKPITPAP